MGITHAIARPLLPVLASGLHRAPLKTRLGGVSTILDRLLNLGAMGDVREATLRNGIRLPVRLSDYNGRMLYFFGTPDPKIIGVCSALLRPGDVFLDIGANHGAVGLLTHSFVQPGGTVHFVEPQHELCEGIRRALARRELSHCVVHEIGLWDEDGELELIVPDDHTGAAHLAEQPQAAPRRRTPVRDISAFLRETVSGRAFGAKVDVEGAESRILPAILEHPAMRFVVFECNAPENAARHWDAAEAAGIELFGLRRHLFKTRIQRIASAEHLKRFHDAVAVRTRPGRAPDRPVHPRVLATLVREDAGAAPLPVVIFLVRFRSADRANRVCELL